MSQIQTPERDTQIGGSEAAAILGVSPYQNAIDVFMYKTGMKTRPAPNIAMRAGIHNEPLVADLYREYRHLTPSDIALYTPAEMKSSKYPFMIGHLDRIARDVKENADLWGVECKTTNSRLQWHWGELESDEIPPYYMTQVQHYMGICETLPFFDIPVLIDNNDFRIYRVPRSEKMINLLYEVEGEFIDNLKRGIPPDIDNSKASTEFLSIKYHEVSDEVITVEDGSDDFQLIVGLYQNGRDKKRAEESYKLYANKIRERMGNARRMTGEGFSISLSKAGLRTKVDWKGLAEDNIGEEVLKEQKEHYTSETLTTRALRPNFKNWKK